MNLDRSLIRSDIVHSGIPLEHTTVQLDSNVRCMNSDVLTEGINYVAVQEVANCNRLPLFTATKDHCYIEDVTNEPSTKCNNENVAPTTGTAIFLPMNEEVESYHTVHGNLAHMDTEPQVDAEMNAIYLNLLMHTLISQPHAE